MNFIKSVKNLTSFEWGLWLGSVTVLVLSFLLAGNRDGLTLGASVMGATALIFTAKGDAIGPLLMVVFSLLYAVISFRFRYYGEMVTYLGMTAPTAFASMIAWLRHPYSEREVEVSSLKKSSGSILLALTAVVTVGFFYILRAGNTPNLIFSTISITTSFIASGLTVLRNPWYAAAYACNDVILIVLWVLATRESMSYLPMIFCFIIFLVNDLYGFWNWRRMKQRQVDGGYSPLYNESRKKV